MLINNSSLNLEDLKRKAYLALLKSGRPLTIPASSWSMSPILKDGDLITIRYIGPDGMKIGDIVAFKRKRASNVVATNWLSRVTMTGGRIWLQRAMPLKA